MHWRTCPASSLFGVAVGASPELSFLRSRSPTLSPSEAAERREWSRAMQRLGLVGVRAHPVPDPAKSRERSLPRVHPMIRLQVVSRRRELVGRKRPNRPQIDGAHAVAQLVDGGLRLHSCPVVRERSESVEGSRANGGCVRERRPRGSGALAFLAFVRDRSR